MLIPNQRGDQRNLHLRLKSVAHQKWASTYDHVVFYGQKSPAPYLQALQAQVPDLPLSFINVQPTFAAAVAFQRLRHTSAGLANALAHGCWHANLSSHSTHYKATVWFWFGGFLKYLPVKYENILRLDDDCVLTRPDSMDPRPPPGTLIASSMFRYKLDTYVDGMATLFHNLSKQHGSNSTYEGWVMPITHVLWINVPWARSIKWVFDAVNRSNCIFTNRWEEQRIWGAAIRLMFDDVRYDYDKQNRQKRQRTRKPYQTLGLSHCLGAHCPTPEYLKLQMRSIGNEGEKKTSRKSSTAKRMRRPITMAQSWSTYIA